MAYYDRVTISRRTQLEFFRLLWRHNQYANLKKKLHRKELTPVFLHLTLFSSALITVRSCGKAAGNWVLCLSAQGTGNRSLPIRIISAHLPPPLPPPPSTPPPSPSFVSLAEITGYVSFYSCSITHFNPSKSISYERVFVVHCILLNCQTPKFYLHSCKTYCISTVQHIQCNSHITRTCLHVSVCVYKIFSHRCHTSCRNLHKP